ncbi:MAG: hypothetical protein Kow0013_01100 [Pararhodobacter sp.]
MDADDRESGISALDAERARLIGSIYDVVLRPESFDSFMADWSSYVEQAARRLGTLRATDGQMQPGFQDPVIEAHFQRAMALFDRIGRGEGSPAPGGTRQDALLRLCRGGHVEVLDSAAFRVFGEAPDLEAVREALDPDSAARLGVFLAAFERAPAAGRFAVLALSDAVGHGDMPGGGLVAAVTCRMPGGEGFSVELRPMTIRWSPSLSTFLVQSFRLTPREIALVRDLVSGLDLQRIAQSSGRSLNTLRAQLKSVFAKTRTATQSDLMRLVAVLVMHGPETGPDAEAPNPEKNEIRIEMDDGRRVPVYLMGPEDGAPVVFVHGMLEGLGVTRHLDAALRAHGLRLIVPVRANFGPAPADPRYRDAPDRFARDLGAILDALGCGNVVMLGHLAGAIGAFAAAARLGSRVSAVVNVSGSVPVRSIDQLACMTPRQRAVAYTARFAPALLPAILRAGIAQIDSANPMPFMTSLYPEGSRDRALVEDPAIGASIIEGYRFTVAQGVQAFRADAYHVTRDWSALVEQSDCPVLLIHGARDTVISVQSVRDFARQRPRITLIEEPDEGQLLFYARPAAVLGRVAAMIRRNDRPEAPAIA